MKGHKDKKPLSKKAKVLLTGGAALVAAGALTVYFLSYYSVPGARHITLDVSNVPAPVNEPGREADLEVGDVTLHYAVYGEEGRQPLVLVHGNRGSHKSLAAAARYLANDYTVYAIDSRCHGQSSDPDEITYELMAEDLAGFVTKLGLEKPILAGHSDGGIVVLLTAYRYPDLPGAVLAFGPNSRPEGLRLVFTGTVHRKDGKLSDLMLDGPHMTEEDLAKIQAPTALLFGMFDITKPDDVRYLHENIPGCALLVFNGETHGSYVAKDGAKCYEAIRLGLEAVRYS